MADIELGYIGHRRDGLYVMIVQSVAGIDLQPLAKAFRYRDANPLQLMLLLVCGLRVGIMTGMNFDSRRT